MATYKVIQDIEAEDKFLGPLTLKQFIFGSAAVLFTYLSFFAVTKGAAFLVAVFMPPAMLGAFLAIPWSSQQPTEIWVLAKLRFKLKPRERIWDQAGLEELVTITVPKKIEKNLTNGLDQTEVESRLKALAETIDTRGWAVKNATLTSAYPGANQTGERLINLDSIPRVIPDVDVDSFEDMLGEDTPVSANFEHMIEESSMIHKQQSIEKMERIRQGEPLGSIKQPEVHFTPQPDLYQQSSPMSARDEELLSKRLHNNTNAQRLATNHMPMIRVSPIDGSVSRPNTVATPKPVNPVNPASLPQQNQTQAELTKQSNSANIELLSRDNDKTLDTLTRIAKRENIDSGDEVVVSLR